MIKAILVSRRFWALVIGLFVLFAETIFPNFVLDEEAAIGFVIVISSYILSVTVDPGPGGWRGIFLSRKFWAALVGFVFLLLRSFGIVIPAELSPEFVQWAMVMLGAFIAGIGLETPANVMGLRGPYRERLVHETGGKKPGFRVKPDRPDPLHGPASRE